MDYQLLFHTSERDFNSPYPSIQGSETRSKIPSLSDIDKLMNGYDSKYLQVFRGYGKTDDYTELVEEYFK